MVRVQLLYYVLSFFTNYAQRRGISLVCFICDVLDCEWSNWGTLRPTNPVIQLQAEDSWSPFFFMSPSSTIVHVVVIALTLLNILRPSSCPYHDTILFCGIGWTSQHRTIFGQDVSWLRNLVGEAADAKIANMDLHMRENLCTKTFRLPRGRRDTGKGYRGYLYIKLL